MTYLDRLQAEQDRAADPVQMILDTRIAELEATVQRVRALHRPHCDTCGMCGQCDFPWPCPTIRALDGDGDE